MSPLHSKVMPMFFVVDTSKLMIESTMEMFARSMDDTIESLCSLCGASSNDFEVRLAVLFYGRGCRWFCSNGLVSEMDFKWMDCYAEGASELDAALAELNSKLSPTAYLDVVSQGGYFPVVIFVIGSDPSKDYKQALSQLRHNVWYQHAAKIALRMGDDVSLDVAADIVGSADAVATPNNLALFARLISFKEIPEELLICDSSTTSTGTVFVSESDSVSPESGAY